MREVIIKLRFNRVCLGAAKRKHNGYVVFCFERDPSQRVMFLSSVWTSLLRYAAKLTNRHQAAVKKIDWCPVIDGTPKKDWRRTIVRRNQSPGEKSRTHFAVHEAFVPGDIITLSAVLPAEISEDDFFELMTVVGKYRGFSPFNIPQEKYGTFEVLSIENATGFSA
jgi:hypothetical protein